MRVEDRTNRMAHRMDGAKPLLKGGGTHRRRAHHMGARLYVIRRRISTRQIVDHKAHALKRDALRHGVIMRAAEGLDAMRKGIKAGAGGDEIRHADRQFGIGDDDAWQHFRVEDNLLHMRLRIGDNAGPPNLGPGTGGCRHGDDRGDGVSIGAGPPVADILEIPDRPCLTGHKGNHLAKIKSRATAKGDHTIMPASLVGFDTGREIHLVRVRVDLCKQRMFQPGRRQTVQRPCGNRQTGKPAVCDQQRAADTNLRASLGKFRNSSSAKTNRRRIGPVSSEVHDVTFFR